MVERVYRRAAAASWIKSPLNLATAWFVAATLLQWSGSRFTGQFHRYLCSLTDMTAVRSIARSGGLPMSMRELGSLLAAPAAKKEKA